VRPVLLVHGGAGRVPEDGGGGAREGLAASAGAAWRLLEEGGPAMEAVIAAVQALEEDPSFNAGYGSVLTEDGDVEMDAAIMDGNTMRAGGSRLSGWCGIPSSSPGPSWRRGGTSCWSGRGRSEWRPRAASPAVRRGT